MKKIMTVGTLLLFIFLNSTNAYVVKVDSSSFPKEDAYMLLGGVLGISILSIIIGQKNNKPGLIDFGFSIIGMALFFIIFGGWQIFF